ncbi:hypothetical protein BRC75_06600 [Halobacteriales archaeon QH_7_69_31]|nr:MAG: hypothetical protein BRC75_06600 [Halobacteriales archaeon QH_7_69_31]
MLPGSDDAGRTSDPVEIERPGPEPPSVDDPRGAVDLEAGDDVDALLLRTFWGAVIAVDVAMAAIPLGLLVIYFRGDLALGGLALAVGFVAAGAAVRCYLTFRADRRNGEAAP